jgi:hypothetical protein
MRRGLVLAAAALALIVACSAALTSEWFRGYEPDCDGYAFDSSKWADEPGDGREHQAEALVECNALVGLTRNEVGAMLGRQDSQVGGRRIMVFSAGWVNDGLGPGDGQSLYVILSRSDRVLAARLAYPQ